MYLQNNPKSLHKSPMYALDEFVQGIVAVCVAVCVTECVAVCVAVCVAARCSVFAEGMLCRKYCSSWGEQRCEFWCV